MKDNMLDVRDPDTLARILQVFATLDGVRWSHQKNYGQINFCVDNLSPDEKLLTHWLCYITDRQISFEKVWDVWGYVISHLVRSYTQNNSTLDNIFGEHYKPPAGNKGPWLYCPIEGENQLLSHYGVTKGPVQFTSRYMPSDIISIYRTLHVLDAVAGRSFTRYMHIAVNGESNQSAALYRLAVALHFLTYADIGQVKREDVRPRMRGLPRAIEKHIESFKTAPIEFFQNREKRFSPYKKKRLWCSIRDFMKSPHYNDLLVSALNEVDPSEAKRWRRTRKSLQKALSVIELPGDVWNNDRVFRDGLFSPHIKETPKTWDMARTIREIHNVLPRNKTTFYPEQLDVTFSFVPRMCAVRNCNICLFGGGISRLCHKKAGLLCPVTLAACGYTHPCSPKVCTFKLDRVKALCQSRIM